MLPDGWEFRLRQKSASAERSTCVSLRYTNPPTSEKAASPDIITRSGGFTRRYLSGSDR